MSAVPEPMQTVARSADAFTRGAVWAAKRPGSRVPNRVVLGTGPLPKLGYDGIFYRAAGKDSWCSMEAWLRWEKDQQGEFVHVDPEVSRG